MEDEPVVTVEVHVAVGVGGAGEGGVLEGEVRRGVEGGVGEVVLADHADTDVGGWVGEGPDGVAVRSTPEMGGGIGDVVGKRRLGQVHHGGHHGRGKDRGLAPHIQEPPEGMGFLSHLSFFLPSLRRSPGPMPIMPPRLP